MLVIPTFWRLWQEVGELEASLEYTARLCLTRKQEPQAAVRGPCISAGVFVIRETGHAKSCAVVRWQSAAYTLLCS